MASRSLVAVWRNAVRDSDLGRVAKLTAFVLATYMDANGYAFPSRARLAAGSSLGAGMRSVDAAIDELEAAGFITVERSPGRTSHRYQAALPPTAQALHRSEWATAQELRRTKAGQRRTDRRPTAHGSTPNGARPAQESVESAEEGCAALPAAAAPVDDCMRCGEFRPLHEHGVQLLCDECVIELEGEPLLA